MEFKISRHSGRNAPADALDQLLRRLGEDRDRVGFARADTEIRATWREDTPISMERDVREEIGRRAVLDIVCKVCESAPELESDWYAVSLFR